METTAVNYKPTKFACYRSYITQAVIVNLAPILFTVFQSKFGLGYAQLASLVLVNFVVQLVTDAVSIKLVDKMGHRTAMVAAHILCTLGLCMLGLFPLVIKSSIYPFLLVATVFYAIGGGLLEVVVSPIVENIPSDAENKGARMALLHSFYAWGALVAILSSTILLYFIGNGFWYILPFLWALLPLYNTFRFIKVPIPPTPEAEHPGGSKKMYKNPAFYVLLVAMIAGGASEQVMAQWTSLFAETGLGLDKIWGDMAGPCMFALMMALGRTFYGLFGKRLNITKYMISLSLGCIACFLLATLVRIPAINLIACALSGFCVSIMWPGTISLAGSKFKVGGTSLFAFLALSGDIGCSLGPFVTGLVSDSAESGGIFSNMNQILFGAENGMKSGIFIGTLFPILMVLTLILLSILTRKIPKNEPPKLLEV